MKFCLVILVMYFTFGATIGYAQPDFLRKGRTVPEISLPDTAGLTTLLSSLKGKVVLIDFWASWCGPCRQANPALVKLYSKYRSKGFEIYGISVDRSSTSWKRAIIADQLKWVQVIDDGNPNRAGTASWEINYIPASYLVSKTGSIVASNPNQRKVTRYLKKHLP